MSMETQHVTNQVYDAELLERIVLLECRVTQLEKIISTSQPELRPKRGWRSIVGRSADNPYFDEVVQAGVEWRTADRKVKYADGNTIRV